MCCLVVLVVSDFIYTVVVAGQTYEYDLNQNVLKQTNTFAGNGAAGVNTFTYDFADRLRSWTNPTGTVTSYGFDKAGNRTNAGVVTFAYDERNRMVSSSDGTRLKWSNNGSLVSSVKAGVTSASSFDALGRVVKQGTVAYSYDGLGRVNTRIPSTGAVVQQFRYGGVEPEPVSDGAVLWARSPGGKLLAAKTGAVSRVLDVNRHGDVAVTFNPAASTPGAMVMSTSVMDPFGVVVGSSGTAEVLGFQGQFVDSVSKQVNMGARFYDAKLGVFTNRDTYGGLRGTWASQNRYLYALTNPLRFWDPTGRLPGDRNRELQTAGRTYINQTARTVGGYAEIPVSVIFPTPTEVTPTPSAPAPAVVDRLVSLPRPVKSGVAPVASDTAKVDPNDAGKVEPGDGPCSLKVSVGHQGGGQMPDEVRPSMGLPLLCTMQPETQYERNVRARAELIFKSGGCLQGTSGVVAVTGGFDELGFTQQEVANACAYNAKNSVTMPNGSGGKPKKKKEDKPTTTTPPTKTAKVKVCPGNSFVGETLVLMADGSTKPIEQVVAGDEVLTTDPDTGRTEAHRVLDHITGEGEKHLVDVKIRTKTGIFTLVATAGHPFWVADSGKWVRAGDLIGGEHLMSASSSTEVVIEIRIHDEFVRVHNLSVDRIHTYYVLAGRDSVLVHNQSNPGYSVIPPNATVRQLTPSETGGTQYGVEYKWVDANGQTNRFRIHGSDGTAPLGSNAANGEVSVWQRGTKYVGPNGELYPPGVVNPNSSNYDPVAANDIHRPWPGGGCP
jgi:RHS repeat-associated protein